MMMMMKTLLLLLSLVVGIDNDHTDWKTVRQCQVLKVLQLRIYLNQSTQSTGLFVWQLKRSFETCVQAYN